MRPLCRLLAWVPLFAAFLAAPAGAQTTAPLGTRAQGMAGAFVGVADDASAVYWNPGGLAKGAYFSLLLDGNTGDALPDDRLTGGEHSSAIIALTMPALGISYYRLESESAVTTSSGLVRLDTLSAHHLGATLVQSLTGWLAVGATVKLVRGVAGSGLVDAASPEEALDRFDVVGRTSSRFDADVGAMASSSWGKIGLVARNLTEPDFRTGSDVRLGLDRQVRAGGSVVLLPRWILAVDADLTRQRSVAGEVRELAFGTEGQVTSRIATRAGLRFNTLGDEERLPSYSVGGSYAVYGGAFVDVQVTLGSERAFRGWGVAGRVIF